MSATASSASVGVGNTAFVVDTSSNDGTENGTINSEVSAAFSDQTISGQPYSSGSPSPDATNISKTDAEKTNSSSETDNKNLPTSLFTKHTKNSPEKCPICLGMIEDRSYADSCYHAFCFVCLTEWSKVKTECPLCKKKFENIIHNIRAVDDFDRQPVTVAAESFGIDDFGRRFRYPTTMTVERAELLRHIRQLHLEIDELERDRRLQHTHRDDYDRRLARLHRLRHLFERSNERREHLTATSDFRRMVYERRLRAVPIPPADGVRTTDPLFYARNPACTHRLLPWLTREFNVLTHGDQQRVEFLIGATRHLLTRAPIESMFFRGILSSYLGPHTEAFAHEFACFARSPYDMEEYDRRVQYEPWLVARERLRRPGDPPPQEIVLGNSPSPEPLEAPGVSTVDSNGHFSRPYRNPSPPPLQFSTLARNASWNERVQRLKSNLARLYAQKGARPAFSSVVDLSDEEETENGSPRLDPSARTPPYLLPSKKRKLEDQNGAGVSEKRMRRSETAVADFAYSVSGDDENGPSTSTNAVSGFKSYRPSVSANNMRSPSFVDVEASPEIMEHGYSRQIYNDSDDQGPSARTRFFFSSPSPSSGYSKPGSYRGSPLSSYVSPSSMHSARYSGFDERWRSGPSSMDSSRSSISSADSSEIEVVAELKPKHLRTPDVVTLEDDNEGEKKADKMDSKVEKKVKKEKEKKKRRHRHEKHSHKHRRHRHHKSGKKSKKEKKQKHRNEEDREKRDGQSSSRSHSHGSHREEN